MCICVKQFICAYLKNTSILQIGFAKWNGQWSLNFLILYLKASKREHSFIFPGIKAQTFGAKEGSASFPYFTDLGTLLENSLVLWGYDGRVLLILKTSPIIADEMPW